MEQEWLEEMEGVDTDSTEKVDHQLNINRGPKTRKTKHVKTRKC